MIRKFKALGQILMAVMAIGAMAASTAQALPGELHVAAAAPKSVLSGEILSAASPHTLTAGKATLKCEVANLEGEASGLAFKEVSLTPTFSKCRLAGTAMEVRVNGCKYQLTGTAELTATLAITGCTAGKVLEAKSLVTSCTLTIKEQGPLSHVVFENVAGSPEDLVANSTLTGIHVVTDGTECPEPNGTTVANASFSGKTTIKAFENAGPGEELTEFGHKFTTIKRGGQWGLSAIGTELHVAAAAPKSVLSGEILSAASPHTLTAGKATLKCEVANLEGEASGLAFKEVSLTPTFSKCRLAGTAMEVRVNGCKYQLTGTAELTATLAITGCTAGKVLEAKSLVTSCTLTIKEQGPLSHVVFENVAGSPEDLVANSTLTGIHVVTDGTECPEPNGTTVANASFSGKTTIKAFENAGPGEELTEFGHKFTTIKRGGQWGLSAT